MSEDPRMAVGPITPADPAMRGLVAGLAHVGLGIDDMEASRAFYSRLGLEEIPRPFPPGPIDGMWWRLADGTMVHMIKRPVAPHIQLEHFALHVADLEEAIATLEAAGYSVSRRPHDPGAGHQGFVSDPAGNLIELNQDDGLYGR